MKLSEVDNPSVLSVVENAANTTSNSPVTTQALRGRRSTIFPTFAQVPVS